MGLSFLRGLVAAVNPCAFVMLPTYLMYFLGLEGHQPGSQRATVRRALLVAGAVSAGFMSVFVVVGVISQYVTTWLEANARYATLVIGLVFVVVGVAMLLGHHLPISTPQVGAGGRDRSMGAMAVYGVAYAVASIGCTLPLFSTVVLFGNVDRAGWASGVTHVLAYGAGMALIVTALTIALAVANTGLLRLLRAGSEYVDRIAAIFVLMSGVYLVYYFWVVDVNEERSPVTDRVQRLQERIQVALLDHWQPVAVALVVVVVSALGYVVGRRSDGRTVPSADADHPATPAS